MLPVIRERTGDLVSRNNLKEALKFLKGELEKDQLPDTQLLDRIVLANRTYNELKEQKIDGSIDRKTIVEEESKIGKNILVLADDIANRKTTNVNLDALPNSESLRETGLASVVKSSGLIVNIVELLIATDDKIENLILKIAKKERQKAYEESNQLIREREREISFLKEQVNFEKERYKELKYFYEQAKEENLALKNFIISIENLSSILKEKEREVLELNNKLESTKMKLKDSKLRENDLNKAIGKLDQSLLENENTLEEKNKKIDELELQKALFFFKSFLIVEEYEKVKMELNKFKEIKN